MDPAALAEAAQRIPLDLVLVDAPCSGQSMFPLGKQYASAFHKNIIKKNSMRQRRILSESLRLVAPGGLLAYTTCTFSTEENEKNLQWLTEHNPEFSVQEITEYQEFRSGFSQLPCYRLFPWQGLGTGGFLAVLKRDADGELEPLDRSRLKVAWRQELAAP
jgi:16S rRNA C967 or C1407 C5-methylase (RsmB/RsmF family)